MNQKKSTKFILVLILLIFSLMSIKSTLAYLSDVGVSTGTVKFGTVRNLVFEDVNGLTKRDVGVEVNSDTPTYIRARVDIPTFVNIDTNEEVKPTVEFSNDTNWEYNEDDGYFYYTKQVEPGSNNLIIYDLISYNEDDLKDIDEMDLQNLNIIIYTESIQSRNLPEYVDSAYEAFSIVSAFDT